MTGRQRTWRHILLSPPAYPDSHEDTPGHDGEATGAAAKFFFSRLPSLAQDRRGAAAIEFALISLAFFPLCFAIIELALLLWTQDVLQSTAQLTARCVAVAAPACASNAPQYAVDTASTWLIPGMLDASGVSIQTNTRCATAPGTAVVVTLTTPYFAGSSLAAAFGSLTLSATGCYPTSP